MVSQRRNLAVRASAAFKLGLTKATPANREAPGMITGIHAILYSRDAERVRDFLSEVLDLSSVDAGGGWPIYAAPPTELAVHPTDDEEAGHELYLMCDDIEEALERLAERGINASEVTDRGWGLLTTIELPSGETIGMYEPRHASPIRRKKSRPKRRTSKRTTRTAKKRTAAKRSTAKKRSAKKRSTKKRR